MSKLAEFWHKSRLMLVGVVLGYAMGRRTRAEKAVTIPSNQDAIDEITRNTNAMRWEQESRDHAGKR